MGRLAVILAVAFVVLTPQDLLRIARTVGSSMSDLQRVSDELGQILRDLEALDLEEPAPSRNG